MPKKSTKKLWRTREGVCCKFALLASGKIVHVKSCPNNNPNNLLGDNVEPVDLRQKKAK